MDLPIPTRLCSGFLFDSDSTNLLDVCLWYCIFDKDLTTQVFLPNEFTGLSGVFSTISSIVFGQILDLIENAE